MNKALRHAIIDSDLSQVEIARKLGVHECRVSGFIHGRYEPTPEQKKALAKLLKTKASELFPASEAVA